MSFPVYQRCVPSYYHPSDTTESTRQAADSRVFLQGRLSLCTAGFSALLPWEEVHACLACGTTSLPGQGPRGAQTEPTKPQFGVRIWKIQSDART